MKLLPLLCVTSLTLVAPLAMAGKVKNEISLAGLPGTFELNNAHIDCQVVLGSAVIDPYDRFGQHGAKVYGNYIVATPSMRRGIVYLTDNKLRIIWQNTTVNPREWEEYLPDGSRNPPEPGPLNLWAKFPYAPNVNCY